MSKPLRLCDLPPTNRYVGGFSVLKRTQDGNYPIWDVKKQAIIEYARSHDEATEIVLRLNNEPLSPEELCSRCHIYQVTDDEAWCRVCQANYPTTFDEEND